MRILIIVPAYNEQEALGGLLAEIRALEIVGLETVVVDDGSADRTAVVARAGGARVLRLCGNLGIGGAVQSGIRLAHREGFDCAVQIDGDGQHPPAELAKTRGYKVASQTWWEIPPYFAKPWLHDRPWATRAFGGMVDAVSRVTNVMRFGSMAAIHLERR